MLNNVFIAKYITLRIVHNTDCIKPRVSKISWSATMYFSLIATLGSKTVPMAMVHTLSTSKAHMLNNVFSQLHYRTNLQY